MNENKIKIFVTGGTGYLGSLLVRELLNKGVFVYCLRRHSSDLSRLSDVSHLINWECLDEIDFTKFFSENQIDVVLHCATNYGRKEVSPISTIEANLMLPLIILHAAAENHIKAFINTDTILDKRINHYSLSKKQFLEWMISYADRMTCLNVALEHFYGPGDDPTKFVTYVINALIDKQDKIDLTIGTQKRDFIYIDDVVSAFTTILDKLSSFHVGFYDFEVGSGETIEVGEFVKKAKEICCNQETFLNFGAIPLRTNEVMNSNVNNKKLLDMGWAPSKSLHEGLVKTICEERSKRKVGMASELVHNKAY